MSTAKDLRAPVMFSPDLYAEDEHANYWLRQVTLRLRREVTWLRHERGLNSQTVNGTLPPFTDPAQSALDLQRYHEEKKAFFQNDATARYLTHQISEPAQVESFNKVRGSFSWVVEELVLDDLAAFLMALCLAASLDNAMGSVIAVCLNNPSQSHPTLALAQQLWDHPRQILQMLHPGHALFRYRLVQFGGQQLYAASETDWQKPLVVPAIIANQLLFPSTPLPTVFNTMAGGESSLEALTDTGRLVGMQARSLLLRDMKIIPVYGPKGSPHRETVQALASVAGRQVVELDADPNLLKSEDYLNTIATLCWLRGVDLFINERIKQSGSDGHSAVSLPLPSSDSVPIILYLGIVDRSQQAKLPGKNLLPVVETPEFTFEQRQQLWKNALGKRGRGLEHAILENARRFRYPKATAATIAETLNSLPGKITPEDFVAACRAELELDIGDLAQKVVPRFQDEDLVLPPRQHKQFEEVIKAMRSLTRVHYEWGTAKVWNEGGIAVLFAGPPGTGKTMGAEILAIELDLPMYRIDLSQVVNKYIGETEKNLKRLFDAADVSDIILFFDEADSLFGQRSEVKDAHDRYANLEISYLLERMERFKGLAILATNRKNDLDEAFLRRLRYIIDFPLPDRVQRKEIWLQVIPKNVDSSDVDFDFLAKSFRLAGGHIRSIVFNACLQSASVNGKTTSKDGEKLGMEEIIAAVMREYEKLKRPINKEVFGPYINVIERLE